MKRFPLLLGIFFVSLALRTMAITASLNTDEGLWIYRGSEFIRRLFFEGDLTRTFLKHHPGVPNMWLTGSAMWLNCGLNKLFLGIFGFDLPPDIRACLSMEKGLFPINLYILPRIIQAVVTSACMVYLYVLAKRLFGQAVALSAIILLLFEPFFLAYQRFITTDALQADFAILGLLLFLLYLQRDGKYPTQTLGDRYFLFASGVFIGLATAVKITALFVLPGIVAVIVLIELGVWSVRFPPKGWKLRFRELLLWNLTIIAVFVLIWPAAWVSPGYVVTSIFKGVLQESDRGLLFFLGKLSDSPGVLFYPLVLAYRLSPALQIGLLAFCVVLLLPKLRRKQQTIPELTTLAIVSLFVLLILSVSDSKIDRYINLCLPMLALLAAVGWLEIIATVKSWMGKRLINSGLVMAIALFVLQMVVLLPHYPYYLTYYNPLLGGVRVAKNVFMIGQGEGLETAAQWLNKLPNAKSLQVASWYPTYFATYFQGHILPIEKRILPGIQPWTQANRVVFYINQLQRQLPEAKMLAYFTPQQPLYTVRLHDVDFVQVYPGPQPLLEDLKRIQFPLSLSLSNQVRLLGYDLNKSQLSAQEKLLITFYWQFVSPLPPDSGMKISLRDANGKLTQISDTLLLDGFLPPEKINSGTVVRDFHSLNISPDTVPQFYQLVVEWVSLSNGQAIGKPAVIGKIEVMKNS